MLSSFSFSARVLYACLKLKALFLSKRPYTLLPTPYTRHIHTSIQLDPTWLTSNKFFLTLLNVGQYTIVCLYGSLTHVWLRIFIAVFRFAIERVIYCNMEESRSLRQIRRHGRKTRLGALDSGACGTTCAILAVVSKGH